MITATVQLAETGLRESNTVPPVCSYKITQNGDDREDGERKGGG